MSTQLSPKSPSGRRRRILYGNTMAFPRELRGAIPDLHAGRVLELDSITGHASSTALFGPKVELKLMVKETGKLTGAYVIRMGLEVDAARKLAATLAELADRAESSGVAEIPPVIVKPKK